ncbi:transposable element Tc1 transposase [Trichonephila clavipes]|nr:transposable element Tc1 transposase [Trichonephila clavipes]
MITNFFIPELNNHDVQELWFQQDGATCHTARATIDLIERHSWVYADKPQTLDHLEDNIRRVIADIRPQMLGKVIENWTSRLDYIRASRGSPISEIIFKMISYVLQKTAIRFDQVSDFDRGRIVAFRDCGLSFREIGSCVGRNQTTVRRICDPCMQEGTTDRRGQSHPP